MRERQQGKRAEVRIAARYPRNVPAPVSGIPTQEIYTLHGTAVASERGTRTLTGVEAHGMTACPCAQEMLTDRARERLEADGFTADEIERVFAAVPVATHNQRGIGSLHLGSPEGAELEIDARDLLEIVEQSMSSEIYELMKRGDEAARRREGPPQPPLRRGRRPRDGPARRRSPTPGSPTAASCSPARRTWRRSTATPSSPSASGLARRGPRRDRSPASHTRRHMTEREWLEAPCA